MHPNSLKNLRYKIPKGHIPWNKGRKGDVVESRRKDITGQRFGKLIALRFHSRIERKDKGFRYKWLFKCDCGNEIVTESSHVTCGHTTSCGCYLQWLQDTAGERNKTHGMSHTRFNVIYERIKARCEYAKNNRYATYGARGIKCLWKTFEDFIEDMHESYLEHVEKFGEKQTTIERKDTNGHYCKENCRWATYKEQSRNRRDNRIINFKGRKLCLAEWEEETGIKQATIAMRIKLGWSIDKALTTMVR